MGSSRFSTLAKSLYASSLDWLFPDRCVSCGNLGEVWCQDCRDLVKLVREPLCDLCGSPKNQNVDCVHCSTWEYRFDAARSWGGYAGVLREAILSLKHRRNSKLGFELAGHLATTIALEKWHVDYIMPIPLAPHRLKERGYNQAELLAYPLAAKLGIDYIGNALFRRHETVKQKDLTARQRWQNLLDAFHAEGSYLKGASILIVDDVMTTGATLNAAAVALKEASSAKVYAVTLAKTLLDEERGVEVRLFPDIQRRHAMIPVQIFGREMNVDTNLEDYVTKKASKLDRFIDGVEEARVDLMFRKAKRAAEDRFKAQITLKGKKFTLRSEEKTDQIHSAFDAALDKMERQIERYRGKHYRGKGEAAVKNDTAVEEAIAGYQEESASLIARRKQFLLHPMDEGEAIEQMKLLAHENFFVFYNMNKSCVSVMYLRGDGTYGLIDTEIA